MESEFTGLPRYVITFLYQMAHYPEYLRWNVTEGSHKITLTLTWNFSCPVKRQTPHLLLKTGLWDRLQRTLRRPDGSVPPEISTFLQRTAGDRSAEASASGDHTAGKSVYAAPSSKSRKLSDALKEFRSRRRMRASLSLPDRIMEPPPSVAAAVSTPGDESRTPSDRRTAISYPTTPVRSPNVNGGCPSADALLLLRADSKTVSWPRLGDLLYDSTGHVARPVFSAGKARDHPPNETTAKAKPKPDHPVIFVQRASPDVAASFSMTDHRDEGCLPSPCSRQEGGSSRQRHSSLGQATAANPALNQTVRKCLDSCDKILFRHSTTIT